MTTLRIGEVRFRVYPQDHLPRHVHGFVGSGEVIVDLRDDGTVVLARRRGAAVGVSRAEVKKVLQAAAVGFDKLVLEWEKMHNG